MGYECSAQSSYPMIPLVHEAVHTLYAVKQGGSGDRHVSATTCHMADDATMLHVARYTTHMLSRADEIQFHTCCADTKA